MSGFIPLSVPSLKGNELKYATQAIATEWVSTGGAYINEFEEKFKQYSKASNMVACQSGTAALHLAMIDLKIGMGDLVIAPTLTFIAAVNPIRYVGAEPVFMDCDDSFCMDMDKLSDYLQNECCTKDGVVFDKELSKPVKAIVVVHVFGNGADMDKLMDLSERFNIPVVEDATEAVGTFYTKGRYKGQMAGTIGHYGAYSFNGNKIMTTGGGGMITARSNESALHMKHLSTQAKSDDIYYIHDEIGYNYRMTNLQAAVGLAQLEQLQGFIHAKKDNYEYYQELGINLLAFCDSVSPNYWFYSYETTDRDGLIRHLSANQIQSRAIWGLCHEQVMYVSSKSYKIERANEYYKSIINLPCSSNLDKDGVRFVSEKVHEFNRR